MLRNYSVTWFTQITYNLKETKQRIYSSFKDEPLVLLFWLPGMGVNWRWHQTTAKSSLRFYCCCPCSFWPLTRLVLLLRFYCCCPCSLWPLTRPFKCRSEVSSAFCSFFQERWEETEKKDKWWPSLVWFRHEKREQRHCLFWLFWKKLMHKTTRFLS